MSKHIMAILLIVSLAFNLAVLGMFVYATAFHKAPFNPSCFDRNDRNRDFHNAWNKKGDRMSPDSLFKNKDEIKQLREAFNKSRKDFVATLTKEKFNEQEAIAAMQASLKAQETLERKLGQSLIEVRKTMTAEQAKKFFEHRMFRMDRKSGHMHPRFRTEDNPNNPNTPGEQK